MKRDTFYYIIIVVTIITLAVIVGCCSKPGSSMAPKSTASAPVASEVQEYQISRGGNVIAQTVVPVELEADIHIADKATPIRSKVRIAPGTWLVPEQMFSLSNGANISCDGKVCWENK